jgi:hypothetical protein
MDCVTVQRSPTMLLMDGTNSYFSPEREYVENSLVFSQKRVVSLNLQSTDFRV